MAAALLNAVLAAAIFAACAPAPEPGPTFVRLHNAGRDTLADIRVTFRRAPVEYGDLSPGETSDYRLAEGAYRYASIRARIDGEPVRLQPTDFLGERVLGGGRFTYRLRVRPGRRGLEVSEVIRDD